MVWENQQLSPIDVGDSKQTVLTNSYCGTCFRIDLLVYLKSLHFIFYSTLSEIPLSHHSKGIGGLPDATSVVSGCDRPIWEVNDLVAILELPYQLALTRNRPLYLFLVLTLILTDHGLLLLKLLRLHYGLLYITIRQYLHD